ncbi:hypothetical protein JX265_001025 [Neoarthrinium moseri]|uniref:Uncharacterized protein n=1 Tax=Neoarthrinium moseri TaxID=1658444 RepID=A0A9P9WX79_9PEZI|nr:hypothetical protein JX266_007912 [Neoarthrinium moseri]KAI1880785.1 hypothetical protein JX265_001025 [Neoarthrinium moseri]
MLLTKSSPWDCEISHWGGTAARKGKRGTSLQRPGAPPGIGGGGGNGDSPEDNNRGPPGGDNPSRGSDHGDGGGDSGSGGPGESEAFTTVTETIRADGGRWICISVTSSYSPSVQN